MPLFRANSCPVGPLTILRSEDRESVVLIAQMIIVGTSQLKLRLLQPPHDHAWGCSSASLNTVLNGQCSGTPWKIMTHDHHAILMPVAKHLTWLDCPGTFSSPACCLASPHDLVAYAHLALRKCSICSTHATFLISLNSLTFSPGSPIGQPPPPTPCTDLLLPHAVLLLFFMRVTLVRL